MAHRFFTLVVFTILSIGFAFSQSAANDSTIVDHIAGSGNVTVHQPDGITQRLIPVVEEHVADDQTTVVAGRVVGYRVQVFADNNHRTAKNEALIKERNIISRFPSLRTYISYKAPAWRLRVGDFRTHEEAVDCLNEIKKAFPSYSRELIIVRDRINTK